MEIESINVKNDGYVRCKSNFYSAFDILQHERSYTFSIGINMLTGDIDCGNWAVSYMLSMYKYRPKDFILFEEPNVIVNGDSIPLSEMSEYCCYMDDLHPLFNKRCTVKKLVTRALHYNKINYSCEDVRNLFCISKDRFEKPLKAVGNESLKAMAAIAFSHNKEIFCFPWLSSSRFENYHSNLSGLLQILENLNKIVIMPVGHL